MVIENDLLSECQKGKRRACNQLYEQLFSYLMNICIRYNNDYDEAGAALNAIFLKVIKNLRKRDQNKQFIPWVKTIAINHLADEYRKLKRLKEKIVFSNDLNGFETNNNILYPAISLEYKDLIKLIQTLPVSCNRVFNLYAIDGYNHREIGELLGISEGTSKSQLHLARQKLQKLLEMEKTNLNKGSFERAK
ncbi:MAG: RNA polymerase sigma factor [Flavobacteriales bacterium]|nr:RNA polymerase sigma factor [Flavobacteriales bacterium]